MDLLAKDVEKLVRALGSVETLEALLVLARSPGRYWSAPQIASALKLRRDVKVSLERLAQLNLADVRVAHDLLYRYSQSSADLAATVRKLTFECEERMHLILEVLSSSSRALGDRSSCRERKAR